MAEAPYPIQMRESDRPRFEGFRARLQALGVTDKMTDALRLAVEIADQASDEELLSGELRNDGH